MVDHLYPAGSTPTDDPDVPPPWKRVEDHLIRELDLEECPAVRQPRAGTQLGYGFGRDSPAAGLLPARFM